MIPFINAARRLKPCGVLAASCDASLLFQTFKHARNALSLNVSVSRVYSNSGMPGGLNRCARVDAWWRSHRLLQLVIITIIMITLWKSLRWGRSVNIVAVVLSGIRSLSRDFALFGTGPVDVYG